MRCCVLFVIVVLLGLGGYCDGSVIKTERVFISPGKAHIFDMLENAPLLDWRYLWSYRTLRVVPTSDLSFQLIHSYNYRLVEQHIDTPFVQIPEDLSVHSFSKPGEMCDFSFSFYGYHPDWWDPRISYLFSPPPPSYIAIKLMDDSYFGSNQAEEFTFTLYTDDGAWKIAVGSLLMSFGIYFVSGLLAQSLRFHMILWFLLGCLLSVVAIVLGMLYIGLSFSPRMTSISGAVMLFFAVGWSSFYYDYLKHLVSHPEQNKYSVAFVILGGVVGLVYGYTDRLERDQIGRMSLILKFLSFAIVLGCVVQLESGLILVAILSVVYPILCSITKKRNSPRNTSTAMVNRNWLDSPQIITEEEYRQEGVEFTKESLDQLVMEYQNNPKVFDKLSSRARRRTLQLIENHRRNQRKRR